MLLARRVMNWVELPKAQTPDRHVFRSVGREAPAKFHEGTDVPRRIFTVVAVSESG